MTTHADVSSESTLPRRFKKLNIYHIIIILITLLAFFLRVWRLDEIPPGWRDDELINSLVISQKALDGDLALYYPDASGHEAMYHLMSAISLAAFGPGVAGIRLLPAILGTITVPLTYLVASRLIGRRNGLIAAACMAVGFWSLMYSRIGIRHISTPVFMLTAFYFFLRGLQINYASSTADEAEGTSFSSQPPQTSPSFKWWVLAGLFVGLGFYTYFASRGIPIIIVTFLIYLALFQRWRLKHHWQGVGLMAVITVLLALPLIFVLANQPEAEARVSELALPIVDALDGDFSTLTEHISRTLRMFLNDGDDEWLYNIPFRPVFSGISSVFFWTGLAVAFLYALKPLLRWLIGLANREAGIFSAAPQLEAACAFLLIWWIGGISPGFISVPAASLGHTIIAQSAAYIILVLPLLPLAILGDRLISWRRGSFSGGSLLSLGAAFILLISLALRDLPDYFQRWPERGMVRFLYRADIRDLAGYVEEQADLSDFAVSGFLAGPWDRLALEIELGESSGINPRWYNAERAAFLRLAGAPARSFTGYPLDNEIFQELLMAEEAETIGGYQLSRVEAAPSPDKDPICFANNLCLVEAVYDNQSESLDLIWELQDSLLLPESPLISNPPPPGVYAGPRLLVFAQLLDMEESFLVGDDGLWVDPVTLMPGDRFIQRHKLEDPGTGVLINYGLYDPMTGQRILNDDGQDHLQIKIDRGS